MGYRCLALSGTDAAYLPLLREFDDLKVDYIYSESFSQDHLGQAIMNRLSKAAGYQIYKV